MYFMEHASESKNKRSKADGSDNDCCDAWLRRVVVRARTLDKVDNIGRNSNPAGDVEIEEPEDTMTSRKV